MKHSENWGYGAGGTQVTTVFPENSAIVITHGRGIHKTPLSGKPAWKMAERQSKKAKQSKATGHMQLFSLTCF